MTWDRVMAMVERHRIVYGVAAALLIAMLLTVISMALYVSSGASRLDLSRPGYEGVREATQQRDSGDSFSSTGPLDDGVVNDFQERFTAHRERLNKLGTYDTNALDDTQLQIAPATDTNE